MFAEPGHAGAKEVLVDALTRLGYGSECATWRNNFLVGASEVNGPPHPAEVSAAGMATALTITQVFDSIAIRINGPRAWDESASIRWQFTDVDQTYRMELSNGVLIHYPTRRADPADLVVTLTKPQLLGLLGRRRRHHDGRRRHGHQQDRRTHRTTRPCLRDRHPVVAPSRRRACAFAILLNPRPQRDGCC